MPQKFPIGNRGWFSHEDTTCNVVCDCPSFPLEYLWVSDNKIVRCPRCGKGYKVEFMVWQYELGEEDADES